MRVFGFQWPLSAVAKEMKERARHGFWYGHEELPDKCRGFHLPTGTMLIYTRDVGMHTGGWLRNPDYERCSHLSLSFYEPLGSGQLIHTYSQTPRGKDQQLTNELIDLFFGDWKRYLWAEPPMSKHGKSLEVWHYRLFCDEQWRPLLPRGEVYSNEFTEIGWKSFSELHDGQKPLVADSSVLP